MSRPLPPVKSVGSAMILPGGSVGSKPESIDRAKNITAGEVCGGVKLGSYQTMINKYILKVCSSVVQYKLQLIPSTGPMLRDNLN